MIAGNLCRCTGYQNIVKSVLRAAELRTGLEAAGLAAPLDQRRRRPAGVRGPRRRQRVDGVGRMTTKLFGTRSSGSRTSGSCAARAGTSTTSRSAGDTLHAAVLRSPHAHAQVARHRRRRRARPRGRARGVDLRGPRRPVAPMADPLPLLIPHPTLTHGRTQYALANGRGQLRRRGDRLRGRRRPLRRRGRRRPDPGRLRVARRRSSASRPPAPPTRLVHDDVPGNVGARMEQEQRRRRARRSRPRRTR